MTVLANADHSMRIVNEEVFGPVALLLPFETEEELVEKINSTSYRILGFIIILSSRIVKDCLFVCRLTVTGLDTDWAAAS